MKIEIYQTRARLATHMLSLSAAVLALALAAGPAYAGWDHHDDHGGHHDDRHYGHPGWNGGYYAAPPVIYGTPGGYGYYPPPVVYGPSIGIAVPGVSVRIH
jgi:hypothetical protein